MPRVVVFVLLVALAPLPAHAAELGIRWTGGGTDRNPGTWKIKFTDVDSTARGSYAVDDGPPVALPPGETDVAVPGAPGAHRITVSGSGDLVLSDTRIIVDDDTTPPQLTVEYAGKGTVIEPGVWIITLFDPESPQATGTYRINDGAVRPLAPGSTVVAVPLPPGTYTITATATNNDRDRLGDEETVTISDTRRVRQLPTPAIEAP